MRPELRIIQLTFYKCASQWVRDILTDPEISLVSGYPLSVGGIDVASDRTWPQFPQSTFAGPIYGASYDDWVANSTHDDRAIVVLRDPRDLVVSLVFSLGFSHVPSSITRLLRSPIAAASDHDRVRIGIFLLTQWADRMRSWGTAQAGDREYVSTYTRLIENPKEEFASICDFLGWKIDPRLLHRVVDRHAFEKRTGRNPGDVNPFSHLRKGIDGDWRNYFDRELGEEFEATFPQLLADLGCEAGTDWYKSLPESLSPKSRQIPSGDARVRELLTQLASFEDQYTELGLWRTAAEDRLEKIRNLTRTVDELQARVAAPNLDNLQHLSQIKELTSTVRHLELVSAERLTNGLRLTGMVQDLRGRIEEKNVIAEQRLEQVYELTRKVNELESRLAAPDPEAGTHIEQIQSLTWHVRYHEQVAEDRLLKINRLTEIVNGLQSRMAEPNVVAEERLAQIETLTRTIHQLEDRVAQPGIVAEERLADIMKLTAHIRLIEAQLADVKKAADDRKKMIDDIRMSASYRYGFLPVAKIGSLFR